MVELLSLLAIPVILKATHAVYLAYKFFFRAGKDLKKYGEWAVVTGATDGIGKAYAFELASQGLKVLLVARSEEKLADTAKELKSVCSGATVDVLQVDFSKFDASARAMVKSKLAPLDIGILINNVGMSYPFTKYFHELKDSEVADIMQVNMDSMTWMTRIVLGEIDEDLKPKSGMLLRKRGAIVNTSSGAARMTSPLLAEYSAAKAYVEKFSQGLAAELAPKGIDVQAQTPLFVTTKMAKIRKASMTVPTPEDYVKCAARQIGYDPAISPWWAHSLQLWVLSWLPESVAIYLVDWQHQDIRKRGIKKEKEKSEQAKKGQNPLFAVHWAPKIDIQTLNPYPSVKENLKLCPAYNEKSSCCHETFETEQLKFYNIWESLFQEKLLRMDDHRQAVRRAASYLTPKRDSYDVDLAQYRVVMEHYSNVLHSVSKNRCFAGLLTYVAGMICFSCNITWFQYLVLDDSVNHPVDSVLRVRMAPAVCLDLWALCHSFGREVKALKEAIRDSIIARNATLSEENMDLFLDAQALCDWMHDEVALHPFRVRGHEDADLPTPGGIRKVAHARRLEKMKYDLDVMLEGQATNFNRTWQDPPLLSSRGQGHARFRRLWCGRYTLSEHALKSWALVTVMVCSSSGGGCETLGQGRPY
ncbi:KCR1 [Symbiodinium sp. CCMP2592]|nr:KCR1 [Symbiodinium sp. CCMP2592]